MATSVIRALFSSGYTEDAPGVVHAKAGSVVTVVLNNVSPTTSLTSLYQLPEGARPSVDMRFTGHCDAYGRHPMIIRVNTNGAVAIQADASYQSGYGVCTFLV